MNNRKLIKQITQAVLLSLALALIILLGMWRAEQSDKPIQSYNTAGLDAVQVYTLKMPSSDFE